MSMCRVFSYHIVLIALFGKLYKAIPQSTLGNTRWGFKKIKDTNICIYLWFSFFIWRIIAYSIVLVSAVQWHESDISLNISPLSLSFPPTSLVVTEHQAEIPVLHSSFILAIHFKHGNVYIERSYCMLEVRGIGWEELYHGQCQGRRARGATPCPRSSDCTGPGGPRGATPRSRSGGVAVRR